MLNVVVLNLGFLERLQHISKRSFLFLVFILNISLGPSWLWINSDMGWAMASPLVHQWWKTQLCNSVIDASGRVDHHSSRDDSRAAHQLECEEAHGTAPENLSVHQNKHRPLTAQRGTFPCPNYTLKNKGASRCQRRTFLYKWFHKEPLTPEEPFCFTKASRRKKVLQIIKR